MARLLRTTGYYKLGKPVVVSTPAPPSEDVFDGIGGRLHPVSEIALRVSTRQARTALRPPVVVTQAEVFVAPPTQTSFAKTVSGRPQSVLLPPVVIDLTPQTQYISVNLTYSSRGQPKSFLSAPAVVAGPAVIYEPVRGYLFPLGPRYFPRAKSVLRPPVTVTAVQPLATQYLNVNLTYSQRGRAQFVLSQPVVVSAAAAVIYAPIRGSLFSLGLVPRVKSLLRPPVVVTAIAAVQVFAGPQTAFTYSRRGVTSSVLQPPTIVGVELVISRPIQGYLFPIRQAARRYPTSVLSPPTIVGAEAVSWSIEGYLFPIRQEARPRTISVLSPPAIIGVAATVVYPPVSVNLARTVSRKGDWLLRSPVVIDLRPQVYYLSVWLAKITPPPTMAVLRPPVVTEALPKAERDLRIALAYSVRGRPIYELRPPRIIDLRPQVKYVSVNLTYSRRGKTMEFLRPAVLEPPKFFRPILTHLAYSVRKRGKAVLRAPRRVFPFFPHPPLTAFIRIHRPSTMAVLRTPVVVRIPQNLPTSTTFARIAPRPTVVVIRPPMVVRIPENIATKTTLVRITVPPTAAVLRPPTVIFFPPLVSTLNIWLAYSLRGIPKSQLQPPTVVFPFFPRPIQIFLVRIKPPKRYWLQFPPTVIRTFIPPEGRVCGFDVAASFVCAPEMTAPGTIIVGGDQAAGEVCGSDQQAT